MQCMRGCQMSTPIMTQIEKFESSSSSRLRLSNKDVVVVHSTMLLSFSSLSMVVASAQSLLRDSERPSTHSLSKVFSRSNSSSSSAELEDERAAVLGSTSIIRFHVRRVLILLPIIFSRRFLYDAAPAGCCRQSQRRYLMASPQGPGLVADAREAGAALIFLLLCTLHIR